MKKDLGVSLNPKIEKCGCVLGRPYMEVKADLSGRVLKDVYMNVGGSYRVHIWKKERIHVGVSLKPNFKMWVCFIYIYIWNV